jgi:hypothetical protein
VCGVGEDECGPDTDRKAASGCGEGSDMGLRKCRQYATAPFVNRLKFVPQTCTQESSILEGS